MANSIPNLLRWMILKPINGMLFFSTFLMKMVFTNKGTQTMAVSLSPKAIRLHYCEEWLHTLTTSELLYVIKHEIMHLALAHHYRTMLNIPHRIFNICADCSIASILGKLHMPEGGVHPEDYGWPVGLSVEAYIKHYLQDMKEGDGQGGDGNCTTFTKDGTSELEEKLKKLKEQNDAGDKEGASQTRKEIRDMLEKGEVKLTPAGGQELAKGTKFDPNTDKILNGDTEDGDGNGNGEEGEGDFRVSSSSGDTVAGDNLVKVALDDAIKKAKGDMPAGLERIVADRLKGKVNWKTELRLWAGQYYKIGMMATLTRVCRRFPEYVGIIPGKKAKKSARLLFAVDTSGSMSSHEIAMAWAEVRTMRVDIDVVTCDAEINGITKVRANQPIVQDGSGGGGTDFRPVFDFALKNGYDGIIFFTDMYGEYPDEDLINTLWLATSDYSPPFGRVIKMDVREEAEV